MPLERMEIETWFDKYQYAKYNIGESGVEYQTFKNLPVNIDEVSLRYTPHLGTDELRKSIATYYQSSKITANNVGVTNGAAEAIFCLIASWTSRNEDILIELPNYPSYRYIANTLDRKFNLYQLNYAEAFKPNLEQIKQQVTKNTKLICLTHPNNPTGSMISMEEYQELIDFVEDRKIYLVMDETYRDLTYGEPLPPVSTLSEYGISISTMSKVFGVPGIRIGWMVTQNLDILSQLLKMREQTTICNSSINEAIASQLFDQRESYLPSIRSKVQENLTIVNEWIENQDHLEMINPEGGVTCFPRLKSLKSSAPISDRLVQKYSTFVVPGYTFKMPEHFRIGFGGDSMELQRGLENLSKVLDEM